MARTGSTWLVSALASAALHGAGAVALMLLPPAASLSAAGPAGGMPAFLPRDRDTPPLLLVPEPPPPLPPPQADPAQPKPNPVRLGSDDGQGVKPSWLSSPAQGEHIAKPSTIDQPALTRSAPVASSPGSTPSQPADADASQDPSPPPPPQGGAANEDSSSAAESARRLAAGREGQREKSTTRDATKLPARKGTRQTADEKQTADPHADGRDDDAKQLKKGVGEQRERTDAPEADSEHTPRPPSEVPEPPQQVDGPKTGDEPSPAKDKSPADTAREQALRDVLGSSGQPAPPSNQSLLPGVDSPRPAQRPAKSPAQPARPAVRAPQTPIDNDAWLADREADPSSVRRVGEFRSGKVEAGEGIEIKTVRPVFTAVTRALALPAPPMVEITFDRSGNVSSASVIRSSGYPDVDSPILSAVYQWRATGKALATLPSTPGSDGHLVLRITFLLN